MPSSPSAINFHTYIIILTPALHPSMAAAATTSLLINLRCATDLKNVNLLSKMDVYALVSICGAATKVKTPTDRHGSSNPTWDFPITLAVEEEALHQDRLMLQFDLVCERALGDKHVGQVRVSVKDLLDTLVAGGWRFVSYQVTKPSGRPKGHLTFSYKFGGENETTARTPLPAAKVLGKPRAAYPVVELDSDEVNPSIVELKTLPAEKVSEVPQAAHPVAKVDSNSVYPPLPPATVHQDEELNWNSYSVYPPPSTVYQGEELNSDSVYPPPAKIYPTVEFDFNWVYERVKSEFNSVYPPAGTEWELHTHSVYPPAAKLYPELRVDSNLVYPAMTFPQIPLYRRYTFPEDMYAHPAAAPASVVYPPSKKNEFGMELPATELLA